VSPAKAAAEEKIDKAISVFFNFMITPMMHDEFYALDTLWQITILAAN
jgi:hypothetical protein